MTLKRALLMLTAGICPLAHYGQKPSKATANPPISYWKSYAHPILTPFSAELTTGVGVYSGELSNPKDGDLQNNYMNFSWGAGLDYRLTHFIKAAIKVKRFNLASDSPPEFWNNRSFSSKNTQLALSLEHNLLPQKHFEELDRRINAYISMGIGITWFKTQVNDPPLESPPATRQSTLVIPLGGGIYYQINQASHLALEGYFQATGSDLLDGTSLGSSSGDPNDSYFLFGVKYGWQLANGFKYTNHLKRLGM